jgi:hypothetical protein
MQPGVRIFGPPQTWYSMAHPFQKVNVLAVLRQEY